MKETRFSVIGGVGKEPMGTIFNYHLTSKMTIAETNTRPDSYDNVLLIGVDKCYGAIFKCWDNDVAPDDFALYFGAAGDEFNLLYMKTNEGYMMTRAKSGDSFLSTKNSNILTALASFYGKKIKTEKYVAVNVQGEYKAEAITKVTVL